jgi:hypothetical protein
MNIDRSNCPAQQLRRHGTYSAYRYGCRCPDARVDNRNYHKRRIAGVNKPRLTDATGTRRRLQALCALGWTTDIIGQHLHVDGKAVRSFMQTKTVTTTTASRVCAVYDQLSMTPGPSSITRKRSAAKAWVVPLAWDDESIDDPRARPDRTARGGRNRRGAADVDDARQLLDYGLPVNEVAAKFKIKPESLVVALRRAGRSSQHQDTTAA